MEAGVILLLAAREGGGRAAGNEDFHGPGNGCSGGGICLIASPFAGGGTGGGEWEIREGGQIVPFFGGIEAGGGGEPFRKGGGFEPAEAGGGGISGQGSEVGAEFSFWDLNAGEPGLDVALEDEDVFFGADLAAELGSGGGSGIFAGSSSAKELAEDGTDDQSCNEEGKEGIEDGAKRGGFFVGEAGELLAGFFGFFSGFLRFCRGLSSLLAGFLFGFGSGLAGFCLGVSGVFADLLDFVFFGGFEAFAGFLGFVLGLFDA